MEASARDALMNEVFPSGSPPAWPRGGVSWAPGPMSPRRRKDGTRKTEEPFADRGGPLVEAWKELCALVSWTRVLSVAACASSNAHIPATGMFLR